MLLEIVCQLLLVGWEALMVFTAIFCLSCPLRIWEQFRYERARDKHYLRTTTLCNGAEVHFQPELSRFQAELLVGICLYTIGNATWFSKVVNQAKLPNNYFHLFLL